MNVREALPSYFKSANTNCTKGDCYRVSMYNYYYNNTTVALVNIKNKAVLQVKHYSTGQPEINKRLTDIAIQIASHSQEVKDALGIDPNKEIPMLPNVKTAMNVTKCERSKHLCVAPTFLNHINKKALWAIVDLTDWKLVGIKWTDLGDFKKDIGIT